ncbi:MAG: hypothetical protein J1F03_06850 [Oscillospiraceae bacterium]|nr:hypothetical protein [Oscillospiraceae bacterium]
MPNNAPDNNGQLTQEEAERRGREFDRKLYERTVIGQGVIRRAFSKKQTALLMIPLGLLTLYLLFTAFTVVQAAILDPTSIGQLVLAFRVDPLRMLALLVLPIIAEVLLFNGIAGGYTCRYKANNLEFLIYRKGKGIINLLYRDAVSVEYRPMKFLWVEQGVHVTIKMKTYSLSFDYVVAPRKYLGRTEEYPFEIIRKKIGEQNADRSN